jgi:hypothetical protein
VAETFNGSALEGEHADAPYLGVKDDKDYTLQFSKLDTVETSSSLRSALALTMKFAALDFILLHEIGHICLGLIDLEKEREYPLNRAEKQTLEFDSDSFAACVLCTVWKANGAKFLGDLEPIIQNDVLEKWLGENGSAFYLALIAYFAVTRMDLKLGWSFEDIYGPSAHPPAAVRRMATWIHLAVWVKTHVPAVKLPKEFLEQTFAVGGQLFADAVGEVFDGMAAEIASWDGNLREYLMELVVTREELMPQLKPYQRGIRVVKVNGVG